MKPLCVDFSELHFSASKMIAGSVEFIYQMPITKEGLEGEAKLIEFVSFDPDTSLQTWNVQFTNDDRIVERRLLIETEN